MSISRPVIDLHSISIKGADFLRAARDRSLIHDLAPQAPSLEGYLFPSTYRLTRGEPQCNSFARLMTDQFRKNWRDLQNTDHPASVNDTVTLASLVEKETAVPARNGRRWPRSLPESAPLGIGARLRPHYNLCFDAGACAIAARYIAPISTAPTATTPTSIPVSPPARSRTRCASLKASPPTRRDGLFVLRGQGGVPADTSFRNRSKNTIGPSISTSQCQEVQCGSTAGM